ncbi:MAG: hypothetical protein WA252_18365 [Candidatus Sulfotelmatobacter sp.]|jgi:hypothetical protein
MSEEFLSVAIWDPVLGMETASLNTIREISNIIARKNYGRDLLYRSGRSYVLLRYWSSHEARSAAHEDAEMLRCWARLGNEIQIVKVFEKLEEIAPAPNQ